MIRYLFLLCCSAIYTSAYSQDTIQIEKIGLVPGKSENTVPYISKAIALCKSKKNQVIVFPKGRYDFWPDQAEKKELFESNTDIIPFRICPILIEGIQNLTIDASGSDFIFHGRMQPFTILGSSHISIKNVNIDWDIPMTAQAQVIAVTKNSIDLKINANESPYIIENNKLVFEGEGWKSQFWDAMEFDQNTKLIVPQTDDNCLGANWTNYSATEIEKGIVRFSFPFTRKPAIGNFLVLRHSARDHAGAFIQNSKNIAFENIKLYQTAGLGILSQYSENLTFQKVSCVPNSLKNRVFSGHDDGLHFSNCKGKILVDSCQFSGLMDDPINVHGTSVLITERMGSNHLKCKFVHPQSIGFEWAITNDLIGFIENESMQTVGLGKVESFRKISSVEFELIFQNTIPDEITVGDALENISWTPDVIIRNSYFGSNRARGILISTPGDVLIEKNIFESSGSAILIPGDANGWYESGAVKNVTIRNNEFKEACLTSIYQFCEAIISIDPEIPKPVLNKPFHKNIQIIENIFHPFDYPVLYAKSTDGLIFNNNKILRSTKYSSFHNRKYMISLESCKKVQILNNVLVGDVLGKNIFLKGTSVSDLKYDKSLHLNISQ